MLHNTEISEHSIQIRTAENVSKKLPFTETELLEEITPYLAHIDALASLISKEK